MRVISIIVIAIFCGNCSPNPQPEERAENTTPDDLNLPVIAEMLVQRMDLQSNERVLLVMEPGRFDPLVPLLADLITTAGANYLGCWSVSGEQPQSWATTFTDDLAQSDDMTTLLARVDLGVMLPGANPGHKVYKVLQDGLEMGTNRTIHFHWSGAYDLNGNAIDISQEIDQFYQRALLETDYSSLANAQQQFEKMIRENTIRVTTPAGTDISFEIKDRPVTKQDGNASAAKTTDARNLIDREIELPAGAVRVAPIEETVNGTIAFPDALWNNQQVSGLIVTIENGKIVDIIANSGLENVQAELNAAGDAGESFREFALGFNPMLAIPEENSWIPYYGYGAGVVRLSLGDNTELGGKVSGGYVRWNFFIDATVVVGEEVWVKNGRLVK